MGRHGHLLYILLCPVYLQKLLAVVKMKLVSNRKLIFLPKHLLAIKNIKFLVVLNGKLNRKHKSLKNTRKIFLQPLLIQIKIVLYISDLCFHLIISDSVIVLRVERGSIGTYWCIPFCYNFYIFFIVLFLLTFPLKRITSCA